MNEPISLGSQRDAIEARRLCDELGHCCEGHSMFIVGSALSGLISMLPIEIQGQLAAAIAGRLAPEDITTVPLPAETSSTIEKIVKGLT